MDERITVGITCYNLKDTINRCIASVCAQTHTDLEILIVDDGSTDGSGELCDAAAEKDARITVIHQENKGPGMARNVVLEMATGAFIAFVDGDDYIEAGMYARMVKALRDTDSDLAVCAHFAEHTDGRQEAVAACGSDRVFDTDELLQAYIEEDERYPVRNAVWNKLAKRSLYKKLRMPDQMYYEDILFTMKLLAATTRAVFVDTPLYHYIIDREGSIMNRGMNKGILTDQIPAYRAKDRFLREIGKEDLVWTHDYLVYKKLLLLYTQSYRQKDDPETQKRLVREIRRCKQDFRKVYACRIADSHQKLRMRLFLIHPALYRVFTAINEGILHPLRGVPKNA